MSGHRTARVGLITTRGFRDVLEVGRGNRVGLYDIKATRPAPLVPRRWRREVTERLGPRGEVLTPLDPQSVTAALELLTREGVESIAIAFLHAYANDVHEQAAAAIVRATWHDPVVQRAYRQCAEHYGFLISPCRPRTPEHKGKVEQGGVHYLKRNFLAGRAFRDFTETNEKGLLWCIETAGRRIHGTTKEEPLKRFDEVERAALLPLPTAPYAMAVWKKAKLHPDCHIVFEGSFYSAPHRLIGRRLWVCAADTGVTLFHEHEPVASHPRARRPGQPHTPPELEPRHAQQPVLLELDQAGPLHFEQELERIRLDRGAREHPRPRDAALVLWTSLSCQRYVRAAPRPRT